MSFGDSIATDAPRGKALPGDLLGPIAALSFSIDGALVFACSGSCLKVYRVASGELLLTRRILPPGVAISGLDVTASGASGGFKLL